MESEYIDIKNKINTANQTAGHLRNLIYQRSRYQETEESVDELQEIESDLKTQQINVPYEGLNNS